MSEQWFCFCDLEKAFNSIEYPILLKYIFEIGINGKCWRLLKRHLCSCLEHVWHSEVASSPKCWHLLKTNSSYVIELDHSYSSSFPVHQGVKQGSVLSQTLFTIVIDSPLKHLEASGQNLSMYDLDVGSSAHANDIRAASNFTDAHMFKATA